MRILLVCTFILSCFVVHVTFAADDPSLVLYFSFDEEGIVIKDLSGQGNDGEVKGSPRWVNGKTGQALQFLGIENKNYVEVPDDPSLNPRLEVSLMAWIYIETWEPTGGVISKYTGAGNQRSYNMHMHHTNALGFSSECSSNGAFQAGVSTTEAHTGPDTLTEGAWQHVAMTFKATEFLRLYLNGEMVVEAAAQATDSLFDNNTPMTIGTDFAVGGAHNNTQAREFTGIIDEVAVFNRALTAEEIQQKMESILPVEPVGKLAATWGQIKAGQR